MKARSFILAAGLLFFQPCFSQEKGTYDGVRHSISVETNLIMNTSALYNCILPMQRNQFYFGGGYVMGTGFGYGSHWLQWETGVLLFGPKNNLDLGVMYVGPYLSHSSEEDEGDPETSPGMRVGYRYNSSNGFLFRAGVSMLPGIDPVLFPAVGIGWGF